MRYILQRLSSCFCRACGLRCTSAEPQKQASGLLVLEDALEILPASLVGLCLTLGNNANVQDGASAAHPSGGRTAATALGEAQFVDTLREDLERFNDFFIGKEEVPQCKVCLPQSSVWFRLCVEHCITSPARTGLRDQDGGAGLATDAAGRQRRAAGGPAQRLHRPARFVCHGLVSCAKTAHRASSSYAEQLCCRGDGVAPALEHAELCRGCENLEEARCVGTQRPGSLRGSCICQASGIKEDKAQNRPFWTADKHSGVLLRTPLLANVLKQVRWTLQG